MVVDRVSADEYVFITNRLNLLNDLKIKLYQVKTKDSSLCSNQTSFETNNIHNTVAEFICINIKEFKK